MALIGTIAAIVILVAFRLLMPPVPGLVPGISHRWRKSTTAVLCSIALAGAAIAIWVSRH
jgi:hypothetical protein